MHLRVEPAGPRAWLVRFADRPDDASFAARAALEEGLRAAPPAGLVEVVPGYTTLLLEFAPGARPDAGALRAALRPVAAAGVSPPGRVVDIPVVYDGPDLARVARHTGLSPREVARAHAAAEYRVHLLGFLPGFAYLSGLPAALHTPRLDTPRARVDAGAVGIGGGQTAVYPLPSPGGWNLIGRTAVPLFLPEFPDERAFALRPGDAVRFHAEREP